MKEILGNWLFRSWIEFLFELHIIERKPDRASGQSSRNEVSEDIQRWVGSPGLDVEDLIHDFLYLAIDSEEVRKGSAK